jgi:hypothetical protein
MMSYATRRISHSNAMNRAMAHLLAPSTDHLFKSWTLLEVVRPSGFLGMISLDFRSIKLEHAVLPPTLTPAVSHTIVMYKRALPRPKVRCCVYYMRGLMRRNTSKALIPSLSSHLYVFSTKFTGPAFVIFRLVTTAILFWDQPLYLTPCVDIPAVDPGLVPENYNSTMVGHGPDGHQVSFVSTHTLTHSSCSFKTISSRITVVLTTFITTLTSPH